MTVRPLIRLGRGDTLIVASHNAGKVREIDALVAPFGVKAISAGALGLPAPEETGDSFAANAELKALAAAKGGGHAALSDDSGLCVEGLEGAPGIYSARWGGVARDFALAMTRVETELQKRGHKNSAALFVCALSLALPDGTVQTFEGRVTGRVSFPPKGEKGFGYDPIFIAEGMDQTFAEIDPARKHAISHRAKAFEKLLASGVFAQGD